VISDHILYNLTNIYIFNLIVNLLVIDIRKEIFNMKDESNRRGTDEVRLIELIRVLIRKKWWFLITLIVILVGGILFSFLRAPQYNLTSTLAISSITADSYGSLRQLLPEKTGELININHMTEQKKILSEDILSEAKDELDFDMDINELKDTVYIYTSRDGTLSLTTVYNDTEKTYEINKALFETYIDRRKSEINLAYENLLNEIDFKISNISAEIEDLSDKKGDEDNPAEKEIELKYETLYALEESKNILIENKDYFVERISVSVGPDTSNIYGYFNYARDIAFSFFASVALGLIAAFAANYFQSLKKQNNK